MPIRVIEADLNDPDHADTVVALIDDYANDPMGNGDRLAPDVKARLADALRKHPTTVPLIAFADDEPAGIALCFLGFSSFAAKPLLNIHDLAVRPSFRGRGVGEALIEAAAGKARDLGCCKLTLEVFEANESARRLYNRTGFRGLPDGEYPGTHYFLHRPL